MARRSDRFVSESPSANGTITGFNIIGYRLVEGRPVIAVAIAIDWVLSERPDSDEASAMSTTWKVVVCGRDNEDRTMMLGTADSSAAAIVHVRKAGAEEYQFSVKMVIELPTDRPIPRLEATIRRNESILRSPWGEMLGYAASPDFDMPADEGSSAIAQWIQGAAIALPFEPPLVAKEPEEEATRKIDSPFETRRLVARVLEGDLVVQSILPPQRALNLAIRIAIPEPGDVAADSLAPAFPAAPGPTVELEVVVRGDVWQQQPPLQTISISKEKLSQPSTWALFPFTTPDAGAVVSIEILLCYQGKPLQAATYVSPVRATAVPGERPTLTTFELSGPDEPTDELRPVDVTLQGRGAELERRGSDAKVLIAGVQQMLDRIEDRVSRVLGVLGAPDSFDDPKALELLITLAGIGTELATFLAPLDLSDARTVNIIVNPDTRVLPLELVYAGPPPLATAKLCDHVSTPPPPLGHACDRASTKRVCPYAFWGLHRSIARTIQWREDGRRKAQPWTTRLSASSVLYGATIIADEGASEPLPTASVLAAAQSLFQPVIRVNSWNAWRKVIKSDKPNLLVVLGHTVVEGGNISLYIGRKSGLTRLRISKLELRTDDSPRPLVLLIACSTAALGDPFGSMPGVLTAKGAGAVVGTLSKIVGPHGALATTHLLQAVHNLAGTELTVGDAVAAARRSLIAERRPIGLILVSHGEMDTKLVG